MTNKPLLKSKTVYQAGYANGLNGWNVVGYGYTLSAAKKELKIKLSADNQYEQQRLKNGRYLETSYQEKEGN